jgi:hypothetical protein
MSLTSDNCIKGFCTPHDTRLSPLRKPTDKTPLDERWYIPFFRVRSLYVVELKLSLRTRLARQAHARRLPNP